MRTSPRSKRNTEEERQQALRRHAQQVETRVRELASKSYWTQFEHSPEFAVLFLPGDQFLSAALAERPDLHRDRARAERDHRHALDADRAAEGGGLRLAAVGRRRRTRRRSATSARSCYRRLTTFNGHLGRMGARLATAVEAYNAAVGSLERQVLPQARRFNELGVTADAPLTPLEPIGQLVRNRAAPRPIRRPTEPSAAPGANNARKA